MADIAHTRPCCWDDAPPNDTNSKRQAWPTFRRHIKRTSKPSVPAIHTCWRWRDNSYRQIKRRMVTYHNRSDSEHIGNTGRDCFNYDGAIKTNGASEQRRPK